MNQTVTSHGIRKGPIIKRPQTMTVKKGDQFRSSCPPPRVSYTTQNPNRSQTRCSIHSKTENRISYLNDTDCIASRDKLISNLEKPDFSEISMEDLKKLLAHMKEYQQDLAIKEDYQHAREAAKASELIRQELQDREISSRPRQTSRSIATERGVSPDSFEQYWKQKYQNYDEETQKRRSIILTGHQDECDSFEKKWSEEMPRKYRKPSNRLLSLKQVERTLALAGDFDGAEQVHIEADLLAKEEGAQIQQKLIADYRIAREKMLDRQKRELEKYDSDRATSRKLIDSEKERAGEREERRDSVLKDRQKLSEKNAKIKSGAIPHEFAASVDREQRMNFDNILPELFAPNDPKFVEEDQKRVREKRKQQEEFQRRNAAITLLEYSVVPSPRSPYIEKENQENTKISEIPEKNVALEENQKQTNEIEEENQNNQNMLNETEQNNEANQTKQKNGETNEETQGTEPDKAKEKDLKDETEPREETKPQDEVKPKEETEQNEIKVGDNPQEKSKD